MLIQLRRRAAPVVLVAFTTFLATTVLPPRVAGAQSAPAEQTANVEESALEESAPTKDSATGRQRQVAPDQELAQQAEDVAALSAQTDSAEATADKTVGTQTAPNEADVQAQDLPTADRTGVTGKTISIPKGEGTMNGMEESFSAQLSTGIATFSVPFALPSARGGAQPSLGLSYSSSSGHGLAGVGWDIGVPFIARQTDRGVPKYDDRADWHPEQDRFVFNGGQELVPICVVGSALECPGKINRDANDEQMPSWSTGYQYFRARVEGSFLRFFWHPNHRTWRVQDKSGVTMELGVPLDGSVDESALEKNPDAPSNRPEIYRWLLVRQYDAYGDSQSAQPAPVNVVRYRYFQDGGQAYLSDIYDTPPADSAATASPSQYAHHTRILYEERTDPTFSFRSGWPIEQNLRVASVDVTSKPFTGSVTSARELVRRYHLLYDEAFHVSHLASVKVEGRCADSSATQIAEDASESLPELTGCPTLPPMRFSYTHVEGSTGGAVASASLPGYEAIDERVIPLDESPSYSLDEAQTTLFDVNSDGLNDVLVTAAGFFGGKHGVFFNKASRFDESTVTVRGVLGADAGTLALSNLNVVPLDLDGDGISNLLHMPLVKSYAIYDPAKDAAGRWEWRGRAVTTADDLNAKIDFGRDTTDIKVVDVNFDGLVDVVRSTGTEFQTFLSLGRYPSGDGQFGDATRTSANAASVSTEPVRSCVPWRGTPVRLSDPDTFLAEMNGDGIIDIVRVRRGEIHYWPGRGTGVWGVGSRATRDCPAGTFAQDRDLAMDKSPYYSDIQGDSIRLDDVNGDGLDDLVQVNYDSVYIWLNVDGREWTGQHRIDGTPYSPSFANRVRLTDINGSGTADILWGDGGRYKYIDLAGGSRPGLLSRVENGLGKSTDIEYTTSTAEMLAAETTGTPWASTMPTIVHMVKRVTVSDNLTIAGRPPTEDVTEYTYRDPVYEGRQREFRGFRSAAARRIGDANSPADVTETTFLLGECVDETVGPRDNAVDDCSLGERWRDNPQEALKGLPIVTEKRNDAGVYLSTTTTKYRLRELYVGLDGRTVRHAFESGTENVLYDTAGFVSAPSSANKTVVEVALRADNPEADKASNDAKWNPPSEILATDLARSHSVRQRAAVGIAVTRTATDVDYFGNRVRVQNFGCESGAACANLGVLQETLTEYALPKRPETDITAWIWRTAETKVFGSRHVFFVAMPFMYKLFGYNSRGTQLTEAQNVAGTVALDRDVSDSAMHPERMADVTDALTSGVWVTTLTRTVDAFGNPTRDVGASNRCGDLAYDADYAQLPTSETAYTGGCDVGALTTEATYDRGLELATRVVNVQDQPTDVRYDGFGRLIKLWKPHATTVGGTATLPSVEVEYFLPPSRGTAHSVIHTKTQDGASDSMSAYLESWSYVDGLGRAIANVSEAEAATPEGRYIVSGLTDVDDKGAVRRKYLDHFTFAEPDQLAFAAEPDSPYGSQRYDAFGRAIQTFDIDGTVTLKSDYHAVSKDLWDAADLDTGPHQGTFYSERTDGHGRVIETAERFKRDTVVERRITKIQYTPFGAPEVIRRIRNSTGEEVTRYLVYDRQGRVVINVEPNVSAGYTLVAEPNKNTGDNNANYGGVKAWRYAYNGAGDLVGTSDARGCGANYFTDGLGRLVAEDHFPCEPAHQPAYTAPQFGTLVGLEAFYVYDNALDPSLRASDFHQQPSFLKGQLVAITDKAALRVFDFDGRGRTSKESAQIQPPTFTGISAPTTRRYRRAYLYDAADRVLAESTGSTVTELQGTAVNGFTSVVQTTYNQRGAVQSVGGSYGTLVSSIERNADSLVSLIRYGDATGTETAFHYDNRRRLRSAQTYRDAPSVWPSGWETSPPETFQLLLQDDEYVYDVVNNPTEIHDYRIPAEWPAGAKPVTRRIDYDDLYRATRLYYEHIGGIDTWTDPHADEVSAYTENPSDPQSAIDRRRALPSPHVSFTERMQWQAIRYDWLGNTDRTTDSAKGFYDRSLGDIQNGTATNGSYQLTRASHTGIGTRNGELTTQYDDAGNLIRMDVDRDGPCLPTGAGCSQSFVYQWDELGRLSRAKRYDFTNLDADAPPSLTGLTAAVDLSYRYDSSDQRVIKSALNPANANERHTVYVFPTLELRRAGFGTAYGTGGASDYELAKETEVPYLMANGVRLARVVYQEGLTVGVPGTTRVFLEMGDHLGSTSTVIDVATSEVVERTTYSALGGVDSDYRPERWKSFREDYRFTGKEDDVEVGLTYFGKRYYSPGLGRWVSADPLGVHEARNVEVDSNVYAYVKGQALQGTDPVGLCGPFCVGAIAGGGADMLWQAIQIYRGKQQSFNWGSLAVSAIAGGSGASLGKWVAKAISPSVSKVLPGVSEKAVAVVSGTVAGGAVGVATGAASSEMKRSGFAEISRRGWDPYRLAAPTGPGATWQGAAVDFVTGGAGGALEGVIKAATKGVRSAVGTATEDLEWGQWARTLSGTTGGADKQTADAFTKAAEVRLGRALKKSEILSGAVGATASGIASNALTDMLIPQPPSGSTSGASQEPARISVGDDPQRDHGVQPSAAQFRISF